MTGSVITPDIIRGVQRVIRGPTTSITLLKGGNSYLILGGIIPPTPATTMELDLHIYFDILIVKQYPTIIIEAVDSNSTPTVETLVTYEVAAEPVSPDGFIKQSFLLQPTITAHTLNISFKTSLTYDTVLDTHECMYIHMSLVSSLATSVTYINGGAAF